MAMFRPAMKAQTVQPVGANEDWVLLNSLSDEFNAPGLDGNKWNSTPGSWAVWSWDGSNAFVEDSSLNLRMIYAPHRRSSMDLFYKSGIVRSYGLITYGYFEARVKGCHTFPGASPAFWLYSTGNFGHPEIHYSEIDIIELQQANWGANGMNGVEHIDMNLHTRVYNEAGDPVWIRPRHNPDLCKHEWEAPWDPRDEYHVYAVESRPDSIFWYIDGIERAREVNLYWHLPMHVTLSLGLRWPHVKYIDDVRYPVPEEATSVGFPTSMKVDYVRTWMRDMVSFRPLQDTLPSGTLIPFGLDYSAPASRDIRIMVADTTGIMLGDTAAVVHQGMGSLELFVEMDSGLVAEENIIVTVTLSPLCCPEDDPVDTDTLRTFISDGVEVGFLILDVLKQAPLQGAIVSFNGMVESADHEGIARFTDIPVGLYEVGVSAPHHFDIVTRQVRISGDGTVTLAMEPETYLVTFRVEESKNRKPVPQALITTWSGTELADLFGELKLETPYGGLSYSASMANFELYADSVLVTADTTIFIPIRRVAADATVRVYHQLSLLEGASVTIGEETKHTGSDGQAEFTGLSSDTLLAIWVERDGYVPFSDQLELTADSTVIVRLDLNTGNHAAAKQLVGVFPNPASSMITLTGVIRPARVKVYDMTGRRQHPDVISVIPLILDLTGLQPGLYIIQVDERGVQKFIRTD